MRVTYYDITRQVRVDDNPNLLRGLDSAAREYSCYYCHGGITIQKIGSCYRLWCPRCGELDAVASKYASKSSRILVRESAKKSEEDLYG